MKKFNINEHMYIQINENGWKHLKKTVGDDYIKHCIESRKVEIENGVWYRLQCHNVFDLFPINLGGQTMFNTNVMFDDEAQPPPLSKGDVMPRELSLHNYWDSNTSEDRVEIVERAFKMIEKQKEYIAVLNEELNGLVGIASVHGWKSNLVEQGKKLRDEMALLHGA